MRANAPSSMRSLPQPAPPAVPSQRERKEAAKRTTALMTFRLSLISRCGGSFPRGKLGAVPFQRSIIGARYFFPQSDREARAERGSERRRVRRAWKANFGGRESRGKGACKEPFPLACSFLTIFLHGQKGGAPGGRNPRPVKRASACKLSVCLLISRCGGSFPQGKLGTAPFQRGLVGARRFFLQSDRETRAERGSERRRAGRAKITNFRGRESRGKGACKEPFPLACSFLTIFLHEQKGGAPGGRNPRLLYRRSAWTQQQKNPPPRPQRQLAALKARHAPKQMRLMSAFPKWNRSCALW
jgi:hypothetical protein